MSRFKQLSFFILFLLLADFVWSAAVSVEVTAPTGSAAANFSSKITNNIIYSPCYSQTLIDATTTAETVVTDAKTTLTAANTELTSAQTAHTALADDDEGKAAAAAAVSSAETAVTNAETAVTNAEAALVIQQSKVTIAGELITNYFDQLTVTVKATNDKDANGDFIYDLYFMFVDLYSSVIYLFERQEGSTNNIEPLSIKGFSGTADIDTNIGNGDKLYLPATQFASSSFSEEVLGNVIFFDSFKIPQGLWMALTILDSDNNLKFDDPKTWEYWDSDVFILGSPLKTSASGGTTGDGICQ
jgi:hypothetical protein